MTRTRVQSSAEAIKLNHGYRWKLLVLIRIPVDGRRAEHNNVVTFNQNGLARYQEH